MERISLIAWDRGRAGAVVIAGFSLIVHFLTTMSVEAVVSQALFLLLPLSVIFWPEYCDRMFRLSGDGRVVGNSEPTPRIMLQIAGWILLIVICGGPWLRAGTV